MELTVILKDFGSHVPHEPGQLYDYLGTLKVNLHSLERAVKYTMERIAINPTHQPH